MNTVPKKRKRANRKPQKAAEPAAFKLALAGLHRESVSDRTREEASALAGAKVRLLRAVARCCAECQREEGRVDGLLREFEPRLREYNALIAAKHETVISLQSELHECAERVAPRVEVELNQNSVEDVEVDE